MKEDFANTIKAFSFTETFAIPKSVQTPEFLDGCNHTENTVESFEHADTGGKTLVMTFNLIKKVLCRYLKAE